MKQRFGIDPSLAGTLSAALARLVPEDATAVEQGRVFVNQIRATEATRVAAGDWVEVALPRPASEGVTMIMEHTGMLFVSKPAGMPTEPDRRGTRSVVGEAARLSGYPVDALHAVTRLDLEVTGVVILAASRSARLELDRAREAGRLSRAYIGICAAAPEPRSGRWDSAIGGGGTRRGRARSAATRYESVTTVDVNATFGNRTAPAPGPAAMVFRPETGRTHQIRIHCARAGVPLLGDRRYGEPRVSFSDGTVISCPRLALHAHCVEIDGVRIEAPAPADLKRFWTQLGGAGSQFHACLERAGAP